MNDADFYIGKPIRSLQTMLRVIAAADEAIPQVVPDGIYGPDTEAAVTAFQARSGLPPTGEADQATWNRVVDAYLKLGSFVLPIEALRIRWQPQQSIDAGEENLHLFPIQAMLAVLPDALLQPVCPAGRRDARRGVRRRRAAAANALRSARKRQRRPDDVGSPLQALRAGQRRWGCSKALTIFLGKTLL